MPTEPRELQEYKTDHDLLIELRVVSTEIRRDIKDLKDGTHTQLSDHETRIRLLEKETDKWLGKQSVVAAIIGIAAGLVGSLISAGRL